MRGCGAGGCLHLPMAVQLVAARTYECCCFSGGGERVVHVSDVICTIYCFSSSSLALRTSIDKKVVAEAWAQCETAASKSNCVFYVWYCVMHVISSACRF